MVVVHRASYIMGLLVSLCRIVFVVEHLLLDHRPRLLMLLLKVWFIEATRLKPEMGVRRVKCQFGSSVMYRMHGCM